MIIRGVLALISRQMNDLQGRTGLQSILFVVRTSEDDIMKPQKYSTSRLIDDFIMQITGLEIDKLVNKMEAFCIRGIDGLLI